MNVAGFCVVHVHVMSCSCHVHVMFLFMSCSSCLDHVIFPCGAAASNFGPEIALYTLQQWSRLFLRAQDSPTPRGYPESMFLAGFEFFGTRITCKFWGTGSTNNAQT